MFPCKCGTNPQHLRLSSFDRQEHPAFLSHVDSCFYQNNALCRIHLFPLCSFFHSLTWLGQPVVLCFRSFYLPLFNLNSIFHGTALSLTCSIGITHENELQHLHQYMVTICNFPTLPSPPEKKLPDLLKSVQYVSAVDFVIRAVCSSVCTPARRKQPVQTRK